jgi:hypothetical protein
MLVGMMHIFLLACTQNATPTKEDPTTSPEVVFLATEERGALVERLLDGPLDGALPAGGGVFTVAGLERALITVDGETFPVADGPIPADVADVQGSVFAIVDGAVFVWVGTELVDAGLTDLLPAPPRALTADGDALWIETSAGAFRWRREELSELQVAGASVDALIAPGGRSGPEQVVWLGVGDVLHGFAFNDSAVQGFESRTFDADVAAVLVADGVLLLAEGGRLWTRSEVGWTQYERGEPVIGLLGGSAGVWLQTATGLQLWRSTETWSVAGLPATEGRWFADELGRLLVRTEAGLDRYTLHRPLRLEGLVASDHLDVARTIEFVPTAPTELVSLTVELRGALDAVSLEVVDDRVVLDPVTLPTGPATLVAVAEYPDQTTTLEVPFTVDLVGDVTWAGHVEPIHAARCASCHEDSANTVLDGPVAWEERIDEIVDNVSRGAMPLVGDPLTAAQINLIEAWKEGGFLR